MNLRHLRAFATIADAGGFARAAARLHLSQPALSRQIQALEADLGVPLFDRIGRRVQLTSEGEDLLRRSRRLLAEAESLAERARELKSGETGILRVGATPQVIENLLAIFLDRYRRRSIPAWRCIWSRMAAPGCLAGSSAATFTWRSWQLRTSASSSGLLHPAYGLAVLAKTHRLARQRTLDVAELADEPLLLLRGGFASRDWFEAACSVAHFRPRMLLESAAPHTTMALAGSGYGIAIVPSTVQIPEGRIRALGLLQRGAALGRWLRVAWDPQRFLAPYAQRFIDELVPYCQRTYPNRELARYFPRLPKPKERAG